MKQTVAALAAFFVLGAWTSTQSNYESDMSECQEQVAAKYHADKGVDEAYTSNLVPQGDAMKKAFQNCMLAKGWNLKGEKEKKKDE